MLFVNVVLPVFLMALAGFVLERKTQVDMRTLTNSSLFLFTPALVFSSLVSRTIVADQLLQLFGYMLLYVATMLLLTLGIARIRRFDGDTTRALALTTAMMNIGNFGLPLVYFAYGEASLNISILTFVIFNIPLGTLAIVIAQGSQVKWPEATRNMLRIPIFYATLLALLCKAVDLDIPGFLLRPVTILGQAAIPVMLVLLGMQLAKSSVKNAWGFCSLAAATRLLVGPVVGILLAWLLGFDGLARKVVILQTSTPSAILPLLYALKFNTRPDLVSGTVFISTLFSALTLTGLLYWLG